MSGRRGMDSDQQHIYAIVEQQLELIQSNEVAEAIVEQVLLRAWGSEAGRAQNISDDPRVFIERIANVAEKDFSPETFAQMLTEIAAHALSPTRAAPAASGAAHAVFGAGPPVLSEAAKKGRGLLQAGVLQNTGRLERAEARVFLTLNQLPQPALLRKAGEVLEFLATGGRMWIAGALLAGAVRVPRSRAAVVVVCPVVALVAAIVEWGAKPLLVGHRSFRHAVAMMVLGVRPRRRSFPSGHAAASWAGAVVCAQVWPGGRRVFLSIAAVVSASRMYLGAHGPGDVLTGSVVGLILGDALRRPFEKLAARF